MHSIAALLLSVVVLSANFLISLLISTFTHQGPSSVFTRELTFAWEIFQNVLFYERNVIYVPICLVLSLSAKNLIFMFMQFFSLGSSQLDHNELK